MSAESDLLGIIHSKEACSPAVLRPLYDRLEPVSAQFMIGTWRGGKFDGGKDPDPIKWYGKRFVSATHVEPLLCLDEKGAVYSYEKLGVAQLREIAFDGKVSASLIYDSHPIMDYFRKVTDNIVLGLGDVKGKPTDFFFHLTRE